MSRVATRREVSREVEGGVCAAAGELGSRWLAGDVSLVGKSLGEVVAALGGIRGFIRFGDCGRRSRTRVYVTRRGWFGRRGMGRKIIQWR